MSNRRWEVFVPRDGQLVATVPARWMARLLCWLPRRHGRPGLDYDQAER